LPRPRDPVETEVVPPTPDGGAETGAAYGATFCGAMFVAGAAAIAGAAKGACATAAAAMGFAAMDPTALGAAGMGAMAGVPPVAMTCTAFAGADAETGRSEDNGALA
jgi:hypothetical protein